MMDEKDKKIKELEKALEKESKIERITSIRMGRLNRKVGGNPLI